MARPQTDYRQLEAELGWEFTDPNLLAEALLHSSARQRESNERLEFLGDRVLGLVIAEALIRQFSEESEGELAPRLNALVRKETCAEIAIKLGLGPHLRMARSEATAGGRKKMALLADAMEAVLAAIYLDGGIDAARSCILRHWGTRIDALEETPIDPKTALQEWAQARSQALPTYELIDRTGPDHAPAFTIRAHLQDGRTADATASSKRIAEREAAAKLLDILGVTG